MSTPENETIRVLLADDHVVVRNGLRMLIDSESDLEVVAEAGDISATMRFTQSRKPDVLVLDLNMNQENSLTAIPKLRERFPQTKIVVLTMQNDPRFAREALQAGATGYVLKEAAGTELITALRMACAGRTYLQPELGAKLACIAEKDTNPDDLSEREIDVLRFIALGYTNQEIAEKLFLSVRTVESHRAHIQQKSGASTRAELVSYARTQQLVDFS